MSATRYMLEGIAVSLREDGRTTEANAVSRAANVLLCIEEDLEYGDMADPDDLMGYLHGLEVIDSQKEKE